MVPPVPTQPTSTTTGYVPTSATAAPAQPSSTPTGPSLERQAYGLLCALLPDNGLTGSVVTELEQAWATAPFEPAEGEQEPAGEIQLTMEQVEDLIGESITPAGWRGLGGSLLHRNADGDLVFTSREDFLRALQSYQRTSQITRIPLAYLFNCDHVSIISPQELTTWLTNLVNDPARLAALVRNPALSESIEHIIEQGLGTNIQDLQDQEDPERYYRQLESGLQRLGSDPRKADWFTMVGVSIFHHYHSRATNPQGPDISFDDLNLRDAQVARRFIEGVLEPFALEASTTIESSPIDALETFQEQVGQLRTIVNGDAAGDRPVRTVAGDNVYFNDLDLGFSLAITDENRQFNVDGNTTFDYQDLVYMLENDVAPETIRAALAQVPAETPPAPIQPPMVDAILAPGGGHPGTMPVIHQAAVPAEEPEADADEPAPTPPPPGSLVSVGVGLPDTPVGAHPPMAD